MKGKVFKRIASAAMALAMVGTALPADFGGFQLFSGSVMTTYADNLVSCTYNVYSWDDTEKKLTCTEKTQYATELTKEYLESKNYTLVGSGGVAGSKVFVVKSNLTTDKRITIQKGSDMCVDIIVPEGVTFKCVRGISCSCDKSSYAKLRFFGNGKVITTTSSKYASIGGDNKEVNGIIELHGPSVEASGGGYSAAIGGGYSEMDPDSAGEKSCIKIYAGIIRANSPADGAGIGCGKDSGNLGDGIYIYGGNIEATGGAEADMNGTIEISGENTRVKARGGTRAAGIGAGCGCGSTISKGDIGGKITINCGENSNIEVYGGSTINPVDRGANDHPADEGGAAIGAAYQGNMHGKVWIKGGKIKLYSGYNAAGIGGGEESTLYQGDEGGKVYICGGIMEITLRNSNSQDRKGNEAIGAGANDSKSGSIYIHYNNNQTDAERAEKGNSYMRVSYKNGDNWVAVKAGDRTDKLHSHKDVKAEPCDHTDGNGHSGKTYTVNNDETHTVKCKYCDMTETKEHSVGTCVCGKTGGTYTVSLNTAAGNANVKVAPGNSITLPYSKGDILTSNTTPRYYYRVEGWILDGVTPEEKYEPGSDVTVNGNMSFTASTESVNKIDLAEAKHGLLTSSLPQALKTEVM